MGENLEPWANDMRNRPTQGQRKTQRRMAETAKDGKGQQFRSLSEQRAQAISP